MAVAQATFKLSVDTPKRVAGDSLPTSNISLSSIRDMFYGNTPISLGAYYAGGGNVSLPAPTSAAQSGPIPASGTIKMSNFLGVGGNVGVENDYLILSKPGTYLIATPPATDQDSSFNLDFVITGAGAGGGGGWATGQPKANPLASGGGGGAGRTMASLRLHRKNVFSGDYSLLGLVQRVKAGTYITVVVGKKGLGGYASTVWDGARNAGNGTSGTSTSISYTSSNGSLVTYSAAGGVGGVGGSYTYAYYSDMVTRNVPGGSTGAENGIGLFRTAARGGDGGPSHFAIGGDGGLTSTYGVYAASTPPITTKATLSTDTVGPRYERNRNSYTYGLTATYPANISTDTGFYWDNAFIKRDTGGNLTSFVSGDYTYVKGSYSESWSVVVGDEKSGVRTDYAGYKLTRYFNKWKYSLAAGSAYYWLVSNNPSYKGAVVCWNGMTFQTTSKTDTSYNSFDRGVLKSTVVDGSGWTNSYYELGISYGKESDIGSFNAGAGGGGGAANATHSDAGYAGAGADGADGIAIIKFSKG